MMSATMPDKSKPNTSLLIRGAIWIAIGALIAAALVCVVWVLIGDQQGLIGRAFLTIVLLAAFAGIAILEAGLAPNREDWLALLSMISWIVALLVGAVKIWLPDDDAYFSGVGRFFELLLVVGVLQLALLHVRLFRKAAQRHVTAFTRTIMYATFGFLVILVAMLVFFLAFPNTFHYEELYWRIVVALTILAAVGTMLIPLLNALFAPKRQPVSAAPPASSTLAAPAWPTYADGLTPLPVMPDNSPDWGAYYTGVPTPGAMPIAAPGQPDVPQPVHEQPVLPQHSGGHTMGSEQSLGAPAPAAEQASPEQAPLEQTPPAPAFPPAPPAAPRS
ncbi:hypothetical protein [Microbacterium capsulatum]|uniref:Agglutinin receptor n=1 Tax=Microbacterium capsulatum TaxID=3041921 RepID=A0ABU0XF81_9MICO|nr:hypothetical protein [Microbacterium sp. ASV81]MDQ4213760.1 hypothetical protein [Microbacterium sp. ASV81]